MAEAFFSKAEEWLRTLGISNVIHETHRKRYLYSPWVARDFLSTMSRHGVSLAADLSHWLAVAETDPTDPDITSVVKAMSPLVRHIHARIG